MERKQAKELVIRAGHELVRAGLIARTWGNVSCRIDETGFVITPSGREYQTLAPDDIVEVKIKDLSYSGNIVPSSEMGVHRAVYQLRPKSNFIIHTHQDNASAISAAGLDLFKPPADYSKLGNEVVCAEYALPGTKALCENVAAALKAVSGNAVIMKHHGVICFGESYEDAFQAVYQLETASKEFIREKAGERRGEASGANSQDDRNASSTEAKEFLAGKGPCFNEKERVLTAWNASGTPGHIRFVTDCDVVRFSRLGIDLRPLLDDFAQIVGAKIKTVELDTDLIFSALKSVSAVFVKDLGAVCRGQNERDAEAVGMIVRKNCTAYFTASALGRISYIPPGECDLMRKNYLGKYSLLSVENRSRK